MSSNAYLTIREAEPGDVHQMADQSSRGRGTSGALVAAAEDVARSGDFIKALGHPDLTASGPELRIQQ